MGVEGLVSLLRGFKNSTLGREQEVFACMVHNLFDEYRFFPKYPDRELHTTGGLPARGCVGSAAPGSHACMWRRPASNCFM
jgi:CCR4-NOT transcription complex subunit 1